MVVKYVYHITLMENVTASIKRWVWTIEREIMTKKWPFDQNTYPYRLDSYHKIVIMRKNEYLCTNKRKKYREKDKEE